MAVRGGDIIHVGNDVVLVDRLQTAGPGNVNVRQEQIYELGNYRSVGSVSDIPELTFNLESFDVSCEMEAFLLRKPVATTHVYDPTRARLVNIKTAFKPGKAADNAFDTVNSAGIPALRLESLEYRFGVGNQNATQTVSLRGDSLYYSPGTTYIQEEAGTNAAGQTIALDQPAYEIIESGIARRTLAITAGDRRLVPGQDYTENVTGIANGAGTVTVTIREAVPVTETISVMYASPTTEVFPQSVHAAVSGVYTTLAADVAAGVDTLTLTADPGFKVGDAIAIGNTGAELAQVESITGTTLTLTAPLGDAHTGGVAVAQYVPTVKPGALRGKHIDLYVGPAHPVGTDKGTALGTRRGGIQSAQVNWRAQLQNDEELGSATYTDVSFEVPEVSGQFTVRPATPQAMVALMQDLVGESNRARSTQLTDAPLLDVQVLLRNPLDGRVIKRLHVPDARFTLPGYSGRVQQKTDLSPQFRSDQGLLYVYDN